MEDLNSQFDIELYRSSSSAQRQEIMEQVFVQQHPSVYRLAYSLCGSATEAEDIAQEVFIAAFRGLANFKGESQLGTWLYRITTRVAGRHMARRSRHQPHSDEIEELPNVDRADADIVANELLQAIAHLSLPLRTVLSLVSIEGLSHQVAADVLGVPVGTIWSRLHSARKQLAVHLKSP